MRRTAPVMICDLSRRRSSAAPSLLMHTRRTPPSGSDSIAEMPIERVEHCSRASASDRFKLMARLMEQSLKGVSGSAFSSLSLRKPTGNGRGMAHPSTVAPDAILAGS